MKIVILDNSTLGKDVKFKELESKHQVFKYDTTNPEETENRIKDAEIVISNKAIVSGSDIIRANNLKLICVAATGYNNIDINTAKKHGVIVSNVKGYSTDSVAQTVFGYLYSFFNSLFEVAADISSGLWHKSLTFNRLAHPFFNLSGKKIGIIGYGAIGKKVGQIAEAIGMELLVCESFINNKNENRVSFDYLLRNSDIITIHTPLTKETENLITKSEFDKMKSSAILINTARGGIVNENDLYQALTNNKIAFAGVDVLTKEPPTTGNILFDAPNCMITPHIAWASKESIENLIQGVTKNVELFLQGKGDEINI